MTDTKDIIKRIDEIKKEIDGRGAEVWKEIFMLKNRINKLSSVISEDIKNKTNGEE